VRYCLSDHFCPIAGVFRSLFRRQGPAMESIREPRRAEVLSAACLLIRKEVLDSVGYLTEAYFLFSEENDLFFRMRQAGLQSYYVPTAEIIHLVGQSRKKRSLIDSEVNFLKSRLIYFSRTSHRSFTFVRVSYAVFLGWSCVLAKASHSIRGRQDGSYVELYSRLLQTLSELQL
jgi:GT2 family glycosyltransferase